FADGRAIDVRSNGVRNITVYDETGLALATANGPPAVAMPLEAILARRSGLYAPSILTFPHDRRLIAVAFDPHALVPARMLARMGLPGADGRVLLQDAARSGSGIEVPVPGWPAAVHASIDQESALEAWTGSLPLYLFVILGPALAGAALAAIFVGA